MVWPPANSWAVSFFCLFIYFIVVLYVKKGWGEGKGKQRGRGRKERKLGLRQGLFVFSAVYGRLAGL